MDRRLASRLRQQASRLREQRERIEQRLLERRRMIRASFIVRFLGTRQSKRSTPAHYLSFRQEGKSVLQHVPAEDRPAVEERARAWGEYAKLVAEWVRICRELERCWRTLGQAQAEHPGEVKKKHEQ